MPQVLSTDSFNMGERGRVNIERPWKKRGSYYRRTSFSLSKYYSLLLNPLIVYHKKSYVNWKEVKNVKHVNR